MHIRLGRKAHLYSFNTYMLTEWLIDIGGISKAMYFAGLVLAHFFAERLYRAALMKDIFLVQENVKGKRKAS